MKIDIGILGMGYVGLPLAIAMAEKYKVIGFDVDKKQNFFIKNGNRQEKRCHIQTNQKTDLTYSNKPESLKNCNIYIVTVPTPIKNNKLPDFTFLKNASKIISKYLKIGDIVIYESTVYPGATEEICIPILEISSLKINKDFYVGYSPERINVGDQVNTLKTIPKIVSASNKYSLKK